MAGFSPRRFLLIGCGALALAHAARGEAASWMADQVDQVYGVSAVNWQPVSTPEVNLAAAEPGSSGDTRFDSALPISVLPKINEKNFWEPVIPVFGLRSKAGAETTLTATFVALGPAYRMSKRIAVGWNEEIIGSFCFSEAEKIDEGGIERKMVIPADKVRENNCLWFATGNGQIGLASLQVQGEKIAFQGTEAIGRDFASIAKRFQYPSLSVKGTALLLTADSNRQTASTFRLLVLEPMGLTVDEYQVSEFPPENWTPYSMVIVGSWFLPNLSEEVRENMLKYVEQGGKLYLHSQAFWRMFGGESRTDFEKRFLGASLVETSRAMFASDQGYLSLVPGDAELARDFLAKSPWNFNRIIKSPDDDTGSEVTFSLAVNSEAVFCLAGELDHTFSFQHPLGKGWVFVDGFDDLEPETIGLIRHLVKEAFDGTPANQGQH